MGSSTTETALATTPTNMLQYEPLTHDGSDPLHEDGNLSPTSVVPTAVLSSTSSSSSWSSQAEQRRQQVEAQPQPQQPQQPQQQQPPRKEKPLSLVSMLMNNVCQCDAGLGFAENRAVSSAVGQQVVVLQGIQFIGLGAVMDELTPRERVYDTLEQLTTRTDRLISVGYLRDKQYKSSPSSTVVLNNSPEDEQQQPSYVMGKDTETIPLDVWSQNFPTDSSMSREVKRTIDLIRRKQVKVLTDELRKTLILQKTFVQRAQNKYLVGMTAHNLGVLHLLAGNDEDAGPLFREAIALKSAAFGPHHPEVATSLGQMGIQHFALGEFEQALEAFQEAHKIHAASTNHPSEEEAMFLNNIACCDFQMGNHQAALAHLREAKEIQRKSMGSSAQADVDLLHVATVITNTGYLLLALKQYDEARSLFQEGLLIQESVLPTDHRAIRDTHSNIQFSNAFHF